MLKRRTLLTSLLATPWVLRIGVSHANVAPSAQVAAVLPGAQWAGSSRLRFFGFDVYDAALFISPDFRSATYEQHPLVLELTYLRSLSGQAIAERSLKEMRRAATVQPEQEQRWLAVMQEAFPDVRAGDRITGLHRPGLGAQFWLNGQVRATIADPEFSRLFFGIWLSSSTSEPTMRASLLERAAP
jgi:hypothetical protein